MALILRDSGGTPLSQAEKAGVDRNGDAICPALPDILDLAAQTARIIAEIHRRGVLHRDISPANILKAGDDGRPELIDFHLATVSAEERRRFSHHNTIAGTLAYIAPELTGRTGQVVDHRADLYAFGATLYELATGAPPFGRGDAFRLIGDHIASRPVAPTDRVPTLPAAFSDIILRLLEKEPDRRYQSADGLADDLDRLRGAAARGHADVFPLGLSDFPQRLASPSRLIGREREIAWLRSAFSDAVAGRCRGLIVSGAAGVGKSALVDQLRPIVAANGGLFVCSRFEPYRNDGASDAIRQTLTGMVELLLAEPEAELAALRADLLTQLGEEAGLLTALMPGITDLIGAVQPPPLVTEAASHRAVRTFLRLVAGPSRPVVCVHDDMQWAPPRSLQQIGRALAGEDRVGLLLVCIYRSDGVDESHPVSRSLQEWQRAGIATRSLALDNLPQAALAEMLGEVLRLPTQAAASLAGPIAARTDGNPFDTLELLNGLRRDGILARGAQGWQWDAAGIRQHVGQSEVAGLLRARVAGLPDATQDMLASMACLGNDFAPALLEVAGALTGDALEAVLAPALEDGLLQPDGSGPDRQGLLRFRNSRVQQVVYDGMAQAERRSRHLMLARRLAPVAAYAPEAAAQYLPCAADIETPEEMRQAAALFAAAAAHAAGLFRDVAAEAYYAAAITLYARLPDVDAAVLIRLRTARLGALYALGRHEAADELFAAIGEPGDDPVALAEASCIHVLSLTNRGRHRQAMKVGMAMLDHLGLRPDAGDRSAEVVSGLAAVADWLKSDAAIAPSDRVCTDDAVVRSTARMINRILPASQLLDPLMGAWLALQSQRLWATHGACPEVVANLARSAAAPNVFGLKYRTGYDMARHAVTVGAACGYEPETSFARQNFATFALHWFEPVENTLDQTAAALPRLSQAGEIQAVCINYITALAAVFDCGATLEAYGAELAAAFEFVERTGNQQLFESFHNHALLHQVLTGEKDFGDCLAEAPPAALASKPLGLFSFHCSRIIIAALFDDAAALARYSADIMPLLPLIGGAYRCSTAAFLRAFSLVQTARDSAPGADDCSASEIRGLRTWLAGRAADARWNFEHLLHFIDAEAAWRTGDLHAGLRAFDRALQSCSGQAQPWIRPWHHALIAERAGLFHLAHGLDYVGRTLLRDAHDRYAAWGASAVARRLRAGHGFLQAGDSGRLPALEDRTSSISSDEVDLLAILRASQALSSETSIGALLTRLVETLTAMTGATACHLVVWDESRNVWSLPAADGGAGEPVEEAAARGQLALSAFHYVERTRAPLLVDDAKLDERFARDPYFARLDRCSLMVLPVQSQGAARVVLMLENRLSRGVFSRTRLNLVTLVAAQLAVSLDNAQLYASLEQRVAERTEALAIANRRLEVLSVSDGLTGLANRRCFDETLQREWLRGLRARTSLGLVMVDIDHFKRYNDRYGHVGGDECLRAVAMALQLSARLDIDLAARYGGEEFALILPGADIKVAEDVARRAHAAIQMLRKPHVASPFGTVTVSIGVVGLVPEDRICPEQFVAMADGALYRAKQQGRNRIAIAADAQEFVAAF
jgi:diguanylate cyclase (GGDEF)-like protein